MIYYKINNQIFSNMREASKAIGQYKFRKMLKHKSPDLILIDDKFYNSDELQKNNTKHSR